MHHTVQSCAPHHGVSYAPLFTHYTSSCKQLCGSNCELYNVPSLAPHSALSFAPHCWSCCAIHCAQSCAPNWVPNYAPHCEQSHASHSAPRDRVAVCHNLQPYGVPGRAPNLSTSHIDNNFMGILWPLMAEQAHWKCWNLIFLNLNIWTICFVKILRFPIQHAFIFKASKY